MIYGRFRAKKKRYQNPSKSLKRLHSILRIGHSLKAVNIDPQAHILCSHSSLKTGGYLLRHEFFEHSSNMPKRRTPPRKSHWGVPLTIRLKPSSFILESAHQILMVQWLTFSGRWFIRKGVCKHGLVNFHVLGWHSSLIVADVRCWLNEYCNLRSSDREHYQFVKACPRGNGDLGWYTATVIPANAGIQQWSGMMEKRFYVYILARIEMERFIWV